MLRELNKTIDIAYVALFFLSLFIEKHIKCAGEDIPLQKMSIVCSHLIGGNIQYWKCVRTKGERVFESVQVRTSGKGGEGGKVKVQGCYCGRTLWMAPNGTYMTNQLY